MSQTVTIMVILSKRLTGLSATLRAQVVDSSGTSVGAPQSGLIERGDSGNYLLTITVPDNHRGGIDVYDTGDPGTILASAAIDPREISNSDPLNNVVPGSYPEDTAGFRLGQIGTGIINVVSPMTSSGDLNIVQGDTYTTALNRSLEWVDSENIWPTLTGSTITLEVENGLLIAPGTIITDTGINKSVRVELSHTQTISLEVGQYNYSVVATFPSGRYTLTTGAIIVHDSEDA